MLERSVACLWVCPSETTPQACAEEPRAQRVCSQRLGGVDVNKRCEMILVCSLQSLEDRHTFFSHRHISPALFQDLVFQIAVVLHTLFPRKPMACCSSVCGAGSLCWREGCPAWCSAPAPAPRVGLLDACSLMAPFTAGAGAAGQWSVSSGVQMHLLPQEACA